MKTVFKMLVLGVVLTGMISTAGAGSITIQEPDDVIDSFMLGEYSTPGTANYSSRTTVDVNAYGTSAYNRNGIFRWNLDDVPIAGNLITNVEIMLYVDSYAGLTPRDYTLRQITGGNWVESEVSAVNRSTSPVAMWTNQNAYPWGDLSTETYGTLSVNTPNVWVTFSSDDNADLLTLVQNMVDGTVSNDGFSVEGVLGDNSIVVSFRSVNHSTVSTRPKMVINYAPDPEAHTVTIQGPDDVIDSFLLGLNSTTPTSNNYGSRTTVDVNGFTASYNRNGIFRWDLDNVPSNVSGSNMTKVEIMLYVNSYTSTPRNYDLRQITGGNWVESEVSAINRSTNPDVMWTNQSTPWGDLSTETYGTFAISSSSAGGWVTVSSDDDLDLLTLVQGMIDGTVSNYGFSVEGTPSTSSILAFRSTNHSTVSTRPKMVITYDIPMGTLIIMN